MFKINFFWLILIAICLLNCTYTIIAHRSIESIDLIKEEPETPPIIIEPVIILPEPPEIPIRPGPPFKPDPIISEPIKITQPDTENLFKKRPFDKRESLDKIEEGNSTKRKEKREKE